MLNESNKADNQAIYDFYYRFNQIAAEYTENEFMEAYASGKIMQNMKDRWPLIKLVTPLDGGFWTVDTDEFVFGIHKELEKAPGTD